MVVSLPGLVLLFHLSVGSEKGFEMVREFFAQPGIRLLLAVYVWFLVHHFLAGMRFLLIDLDIGVTKAAARRSAWWVSGLGGLVLLAAVVIGVMP